MKIYDNVKLGADPELFLIDNTGKYISSVGLIGGSKEKPLPIDKDGHCLQEDNVSVEFNIKPASNKDDFVKSLNFVLDTIEERISKLDLHMSIVPAVEFDWDQLQTMQSQTFGCEPDFNAWTGEKNPQPMCDNPQLRSAGGHIHIGYSNPTVQNRLQLIRALDVFFGVPSSLLDTDEQRRKLYGMPGAFRPKKYGAEYRAPSNFWIKTKELQEWAYEQIMKAVSFLNAGGTVSFEDELYITSAIIKKDKSSYDFLQKKYCF
ncbi:MAG: hypothetical protein RBT52_02900 [Sulfurimonas sp.]|jgi:hypothetical protein|nr:hypothetical protein [Sulfurimonas sp.]